MSLLDCVLRRVVKIPKVEQFDSYLFIGPHPDDIEIAAGGTVKKLTELGKRVSFLICTDGRYGTQTDMDYHELIKIRQAEALASASCLGVTDVTFLPFSDGGDYSRSDLLTEIVKVICDKKPDMLFAPDPTLPNELHVDHIEVGIAAGYAFLQSGIHPMMARLGVTEHQASAIGYFYTHRPNRYVKIGSRVKVGIQALECHKSQFPIGSSIWKQFLLYIKFRAIRNGFKCCATAADGFRILTLVTSHCAPEADRL